MFKKKWVLCLLGSGAVLLFFGSYFVFAENVPGHRETIVVLKTLYDDEITAYRTYTAFCQKAQKEGYLNVAKLFLAFRSSEKIHARNFKHNLSNLGKNHIGEVSEHEIKIAGTKTNLQYALSVELAEIDSNYPKFINRRYSVKHYF